MNRLTAFFLLISVNLAFGQNGGSLTGGGGGGGGTPGGATTQVQFNNAGAFAGDAGFTYPGVTSTGANLFLQATGGPQWQVIAGGTAGLAGYYPPNSFLLYNGANTNTPLVITSGQIIWPVDYIIGWQPSRGQYPDTGFDRNAAGIIEVNNGNVGQFADLKAKNLIASGAVTGKGSVPVGGATNKALIKLSAADYDVGWGLPATMVLSPVSIPAGAKSLVVKNPAIGSESTVFCSVRSDDKTAQIKNVVSGKGSFTVNLSTAPTAETSLGVFVVNPAQ